MDEDVLARFEANVRPGEDGCQLWKGQASRRGTFHLGARGSIATNRVAWEIAHGSIPTGLWVLHTCGNVGCVNPKHLYLGTPRDDAKNREYRSARRGPKRGRPTTVRFWPEDEAWIRAQAAEHRIPVNQVLDEAIRHYRKEVEKAVSHSTIFAAVQKAQ